MLRRENLRRSHQAGLKAVVASQQHAHQCDERLAAAHVPLQQAVHLVAGGGVLPDFANHALLRAGEREGEPLAVKTVELFADGGEKKTVVLAYALLPVGEDHELHAEEFLELEPQLGGFEFLVVCGKVDVVQRVAQRREPVLFEDALRQRLGDPFPGERPRVADEVVDRFGAEAFVVELFGGAVDALHACGGPVLLREGRFDLGVHEPLKKAGRPKMMYSRPISSCFSIQPIPLNQTSSAVPEPSLTVATKRFFAPPPACWKPVMRARSWM